MTADADAPTPPPPVDATLENSLREIGIPPRPAILERISSEMRQEEPDYHRLSHVISADVALAASLVKTANSPFFGYRSRVRTINEALMMLGLEVTSRAVAGIILRKAFPASPQFVRFWDASARIARLSGWLAQYVGNYRLRADDAYTFGLFRDCGIPILQMRFPDYQSVLARANAEQQLGFTAVEEAQLPTNHAMVGCLLTRDWWLPEEISLAIRHHHDAAVIATPSFTPPLTSRYRIAIAQLAEYLLQRHTGLSHTSEWAKLGTACLQLLGIAAHELEVIVTESAHVVEADE